MTTQNPAQPGNLFFEPIVNGYLANPRFVRRKWLAEEIGDRLKTDGKRFVLLTAEPGFGKSAFMAQLAADHPDWLRYFIRRDQRAPLSDVGARSFLLRIGFQLAALYPELFTTDAIRLTVEQRVGAVKEGGSAVGAEIGKILASPFYKIVIQIQQQIEQVAGSVVGLHIDEMVIEPRLLALADLQYMALIDPARAMQRLHPERQVVIALDALDEVRYHQADDNILAWLANCPDLPSNVRLVLTSRPPEGAVRLFMDKQQHVLQTLAIAAHDRDAAAPLSGQVDKDLAAYVDMLASDAAIKTHLDALPGSAAGFKEQAVTKADGNIGYLDALARAIDQALLKPDSQILAALLAVKTLPDDLKDLYAFFLHQIKQSLARQRIEMVDPETGDTYDKPVWPAVYSRMLAVLAVAREPVTLEQIRYLGDITAGWADLNGAKDGLLQFLDIVDSRYRLYHATLPEFLTDEQAKRNTATEDLYVDARLWHKQIGDRYWRSHSQDWSQCDAYGLNNLATHLYCGEQFDRLRELISEPWMIARFDGYGYSYGGFAADVMLAWQQTHQEALQHINAGEEPAVIADCVRLALIYTSINSLSGNHVPELVARAVETGLWPVERMWSLAARVPDAYRRIDLYLAVLRTRVLTDAQRQQTLDQTLPMLAFVGASHGARVLAALAPELTGDLLQRGLDAARAIGDVGSRTKALAALAPQLTGETREQALQQGLDAARAIGDVEALAALAPQLTGEAREQALQQGLAAALSIVDPEYRGNALAALAPEVTGDLLQQGLDAALALCDVRYRAKALGALAPQLTGEAREQALAQGLTAALSIVNPEYRGKALAALAPQLTGDMLTLGLAEALGLGDAKYRSEALAALASQLTGEAREQGLAEALAALASQLTGEARKQALAALKAHSPDDSLLLSHLRRTIATHLFQDLSSQYRKVVLAFIASKQFFTPSVVGAGTLAAMTKHIIEICTQWQWR